MRHSEYTIYTDGSKKEDRGRICSISLQQNNPHTHSFKMQDHATVYQAELEAIYQACKYMDDNHDTIRPKYVKILTDSQAALKSLDSIDSESDTTILQNLYRSYL